MNRLRFADGLILLASSQQSSACTWSVFCCVRPSRNAICAKNIAVILCLFANPRQCVRQVSGNTFQQVETFKYLGVACVCRKAQPQEIDTRIGKANAVLRELYRSVATKRELSNTAKLSVFKSIFVTILTCGHKSWVMTERMLNQVSTKVGILRRAHDVTKWRTEVRLRPGQATTLPPPYLNLSYFGIKCPALTKKILATLLRLFGGAQ